jgi:hypothetical protein
VVREILFFAQFEQQMIIATCTEKNNNIFLTQLHAVSLILYDRKINE